METLSTSKWQRSGSSIVFDKESLGPFITKGMVISLRQALKWNSAIPESPPSGSRTVVISGLESVIETLEPQEADIFLKTRFRPLLISLQNRWTNCGVVIGFSSHAKAFEETSLEEEVIFRRRDRKKIRLSEGLWDGSSTADMKRLVREGDNPDKEITIGYYVARIS